jgi:hypothetical protein
MLQMFQLPASSLGFELIRVLRAKVSIGHSVPCIVEDEITKLVYGIFFVTFRCAFSLRCYGI